MPRQLEFTLDSSRSIRLVALKEYFTYGGLVVGYPSTEMNRDMIDRLVARHTRPKGPDVPYLIEPMQTTLEVNPSDQSNGTPAALPRMTCIGDFMSDVLPGDTESIASSLVIIWFQSDFAPPLEPFVRSQLAAMDWDANAWGWSP